jgi:quinol monooxygenase YgiN
MFARMLTRSTAERSVANDIIFKGYYMLIVNLQLKIKPEKRLEFSDWFNGILPDTRSYNGCTEVNSCSVSDDSEVVEIISKWGSKDQYDAYLAWREATGVVAKLGEYVSAAPVFRFLTVDRQFE